MLDVSPGNLLQEIAAAEELRNEQLDIAEGLRDRYAGIGGMPQSLENHSYEFLSLVIPRIIMDNPKIVAIARDPRLDDVGQWARANVNRWARDTRVRNPLLDAAFNASFGFGALMVTPIPRVGADPTDPSTPLPIRVYSIAPPDFGFDARASSFGTARFTFSRVTRDRDMLIERSRKFPQEGWDAAALKALTPEQDALNESWGHKKTGPPRKDVPMYEVWVPEHEHPDAAAAGGRNAGFYGTIFTISEDGKELRKPRPFWGPSWGPYHLVGFYPVPGSPWPMSPLVATARQAEEVNTVAEAISRSAAAYKQLVLVDSTSGTLAKSIKDDPHLFVVPIQNLSKDSVAPVEVGGVTNELLKQDVLMRQRLDRNSGIDEARRGNVRGVSATEADIADRAGETRLAFMRAQFMEAVRGVFESVTWYAFALSMPEALMGQAGGLATGLMDRMDLDIEPVSMVKPSEQVLQQRALLKMQVATQVAPFVPQMPWVDWQRLFRTLGEAFDDPEFEQIISPEVALQLRMAEMEAGVAGGASAVPGGSRPAVGSGQEQIRRAGEPRALPGRTRGAQRTAERRRAENRSTRTPGGRRS